MDKENLMPTSDNSLPQQGAGVVDKDERSLPVLLVGERHEEVFILVEGTPEVSKRRALADAVLTHATKPAAWWALLEHTVQVFGADSRYIPQIRKLFRKATRNIPEGTYNNDVALVNIWLGFAEAESHVSMDDAREAYEHMKLCGIGSASAMYYTKWATFEEKAGRLEEARAILELGLWRKVNQDEAIRSQLRRLRSSTSGVDAGAAPSHDPEEPHTARGASPPTFSFSSPPITAVTPTASAPSSSSNKGSTSSCASSPLSASSGDNDVTVGASTDDRDPHTGVITLRERVSAGRWPLTFVPPTPTAKDSAATITRAAATSNNSTRRPTATPAPASAHKRTPVAPSFTVWPDTPSPSEAPDAGDRTSALPAGAGDLANRTGVVSFKPALETDEGDSHTGVVSFKRQQLGVEGVGVVKKGQLETTNAQHQRATAKAANPPSSAAVPARGDDAARNRTTEPSPRGVVSQSLPAGPNGAASSAGGGGEGTSGTVAASVVQSGSASSSRESGDRHAANRGRRLQVSGLLGLGRPQRIPAAEKAAQSAKATGSASAPSSPKHASAGSAAVSTTHEAAVKDQRVKPERPATGGGGHASSMTGLQPSLLQTIEEQDTTASKQQHHHTHGQGGRRPDSIGGDTQDVIILKYSAAEPSRTPASVRIAPPTGVAPSSAPPSTGSDDGSDARHSQHTNGSSGSSAGSNRSSRQRQVDPRCAQPELSVTRDRAKACGGAASSVEERHNVQRRSATPTASTDYPQPPPPPPQQQVHVQVQQHQQGGRDSDTSRGGERLFEALLSPRNIMTLNGVDYVKLDLLGRGGSSKVFRVLSQAAEIYALKRVRVQPGDQRALESFANEITLLTRLKGHPSIIQLVDWAVDRHTGLVLMLMEIGETDLNRLLQQQQQPEQPPSSSGSITPAATSPPSVSAGGGSRLSPNFVRYIWEEMLRAVLCVHEERIVHGDLKPANFVLVRGRLKLIDFGIAKAIGSDTTNIMRESQVGTVNYMSPEAILDTGSGVERSGGRKAQCMKMGRASDVWSLGCILYQMVYGRTPFADLGLIQKLQAIVDDNHEISFPSNTGVDAHVIDVLRRCLCRDPSKRPTIAGDSDSLLDHPYLTMAAHRCVREEGGRKPGTTMTWEAIEAVSSVLDREPAIVKLRGRQRAAALYQRLTSAKEAQGPTPTRLPPPAPLPPHAPPSSAPSAAAPASHSSLPPPQHHFRQHTASHAHRPGRVALSEEIMCQRQKLKPVQQRQEEGLRRPAASPGGLLSIFRQGAAGIRRANAADETAGSSYHDTTTWS